jgi:hypothetical protein
MENFLQHGARESLGKNPKDTMQIERPTQIRTPKDSNPPTSHEITWNQRSLKSICNGQLWPNYVMVLVASDLAMPTV